MFKLKTTKPLPADAEVRENEGKREAKIKVLGRWFWFPVNSAGRVRIPSKSWYARVNGKLVKLSQDKSLSETMLRELKTKAERIERGFELPEPESGEKLEPLVKRYTNDRIRRGHRERNVLWNEKRLILMLKELGLSEIGHLRKLTGDKLESWVASKSSAPGTLAAWISIFRVFVKWLKRLGVVGVLPAFPSVKPIVTSPRAAFTPEQVAKLAEVAPYERGILWRLLFCTGGRIGAILATVKEDYRLDDPKGPWLHLRAENAKTGRSQAIPLPEKIAGDLAKLISIRNPGERLFGPGYSKTTRLLEIDLKAAGIPQEQKGGKLVVHSFRHGCVTSILGVLPPAVAQAITGHTDLATLQIYSHVSGLEGAGPVREIFKNV